MDSLGIAFVSKLAVEVVIFVAKTCYKRYKAAKKPSVEAPDRS